MWSSRAEKWLTSIIEKSVELFLSQICVKLTWLGELTKGPWSTVFQTKKYTKCKWGDQKQSVVNTEWLNFFLLQNVDLFVTPPWIFPVLKKCVPVWSQKVKSNGVLRARGFIKDCLKLEQQHITLSGWYWHTVNRPSTGPEDFLRLSIVLSGSSTHLGSRGTWLHVLSAEIIQLPSLISRTIPVEDIDGPLTCTLTAQ